MLNRLLIASFSCTLYFGLESMEQLNTNELRNIEEPALLKPRDLINQADRWNVEALYPDEKAWLRDLEIVKETTEARPFWPQLLSYKGKLRDPEMVASLLKLYFELDRKLSKLH